MITFRTYDTTSGQLGAVGCKELNTVVDLLGAALQEADRVGVPSYVPAYTAALSFYQREDSFFSSTWFVGSESCANLVRQGNALIEGLNREIRKTAGGVEVPPTQPTIAPPEDVAGTIKLVAIAAGAIAVAFMLVPIIGAVTAGIKAGGKR